MARKLQFSIVIFFWFNSLAIVQTQVEVRDEMPDADKEKMPRDEAVKLQKKEWKAYKQEVEKRTKATLQEKYGLEGVTDSIFFFLANFRRATEIDHGWVLERQETYECESEPSAGDFDSDWQWPEVVF